MWGIDGCCRLCGLDFINAIDVGCHDERFTRLEEVSLSWVKYSEEYVGCRSRPFTMKKCLGDSEGEDSDVFVDKCSRILLRGLSVSRILVVFVASQDSI